MDVQQAVKEIRARIEREYTASGASGGSSAAPLSPVDSNELATLKASYARLYESRNLVGQAPPAPDTFRARVGGHFVRLVQRMLFWYTPQIRRFHNDAAVALGSAFALIERQFEALAELRQDIQSLRRRNALEEQASRFRPETPQRHSEERSSLPRTFVFALQDHFRGSEGNIAEKLAIWLPALETLASPAPAPGPWLDIGCGRGEWLALAARGDRQVKGIDSNPASIEYCREKGLSAEAAEAIDYLKSLPDASLSVVTAFHILEHLPMDTLLMLVAQVARTLRPGGLLAVETPNPANVLMASHYFWNDPTHERPIPPRLLEFVFDYCGLDTVRRLELNPAPDEEHLPYAEIEVIGRVDRYLYGPRDYGLIGRRAT